MINNAHSFCCCVLFCFTSRAHLIPPLSHVTDRGFVTAIVLICHFRAYDRHIFGCPIFATYLFGRSFGGIFGRSEPMDGRAAFIRAILIWHWAHTPSRCEIYTRLSGYYLILNFTRPSPMRRLLKHRAIWNGRAAAPRTNKACDQNNSERSNLCACDKTRTRRTGVMKWFNCFSREFENSSIRICMRDKQISWRILLRLRKWMKWDTNNRTIDNNKIITTALIALDPMPIEFLGCLFIFALVGLRHQPHVWGNTIEATDCFG